MKRFRLVGSSPINLPAAAFQKLPVEGGEQPRLHLCRVAQLVSLCCPNVKRPLHQILRVSLGTAEAESKAIERVLIERDDCLEGGFRGHILRVGCRESCDSR